jgi:hypothetical protein
MPSNFLVTNTSDAGAGSLRAAILAANSSAGADFINFKIGSGAQTIALQSPLPPITGPVYIAGNSQPGYIGSAIIELNGSGAGVDANGLVVFSAATTIRGLVINRFAGSGVVFAGPGVTSDTLTNDRIGTDPTGLMALGNGGDGVLVAAGAKGLTIFGNVISGNQGNGITLSGGGVKGLKIIGNYVGMGVDGKTEIGNAFYGLRIGEGASGNTVGSTTLTSRNFIGGNGVDGVLLDGAGTTGNTFMNNFIGLTAPAAAASNANANVLIRNGATANTFVANDIAGASTAGVELEDAGTSGNVIKGNLIGLNAANGILGGGFAGVFLNNGASNNVIGGTTAATRNVIAGFNVNVEISGPATTGNKVQSNFIGTNVTGTAGVPGSNGIQIVAGANGNIIGGVGAGNLISGTNAAVTITDAGTSGNVLQGNRLGTNAAGTKVIDNFVGINIVSGAANNTIGGTAAGAGNTIVGGSNGGIFISGAGTTGNVMQGNFIGVTASGAALGNTGAGIDIENKAANNLIGGTVPGAGNTIADNTTQGVLIGGRFAGTTPAGIGNSVLGNRIFNNGALGIDLGPADGVTANDADDVDTGPNNLQNFPVLTSAAIQGSFVIVRGTLDAATTGDVFRIEFFASPSADASGHGEGQVFLGAVIVSGTTTSTDLVFTAVLPAPAGLHGQVITATATDLDTGDTSEFSADLTVV